MTTQPERLHHLLDRARRGVILPAEGDTLAGLVAELEQQLATATRTKNLYVTAHRTVDRRADALEATVARVRQTVDAGPVGSCCAHLIRAALKTPAGLTAEEGEAADAYAAKLNTPPSAATMAAIAERIANGTAPRRKVRRRAAIDRPSDTAQQRETP